MKQMVKNWKQLEDLEDKIIGTKDGNIEIGKNLEIDGKLTVNTDAEIARLGVGGKNISEEDKLFIDGNTHSEGNIVALGTMMAEKFEINETDDLIFGVIDIPEDLIDSGDEIPLTTELLAQINSIYNYSHLRYDNYILTVNAKIKNENAIEIFAGGIHYDDGLLDGGIEYYLYANLSGVRPYIQISITIA